MRKSIDPMSDPATAGSGNSWLPPQRSSAAMSFQSAIPWRVALRQSLPPLHRLATILNNPLCRTMIFQRTATTPLTSCLSPRVHSKNPHPPATNAGRMGHPELGIRIQLSYSRDDVNPSPDHYGSFSG